MISKKVLLFLVCLNIFCTISISPSYAFEKPEVFVELGHSRDITSIAISPDNSFLISGSKDKTIKLWSIPLQKEVRTLKMDGEVTTVSFSNDGKYITAGDKYGNLIVIDFNNWKIYRKFKHWMNAAASTFRLFKQNQHAISSGGHLLFWDIASNKVTFEIDPPITVGGDTIGKVDISHDERFMAITHNLDNLTKTRIDIFDISAKKTIKSLKIIEGYVEEIRWLPNGNLVLIFHTTGNSNIKKRGMYILDIKNDIVLKTIQFDDIPISLDCSINGKYCAVAFYGNVILYNATNWQELNNFRGYPPVIFGDNSDLLIYAFNDFSRGGDIYIKIMNVHTNNIIDIARSRNVTHLYSADFYKSNLNKIIVLGLEQNLFLWDISTAKLDKTTNLDIEALNFDQRFGIESYSEGGHWEGIRLWDLLDKTILHHWPKTEDYLEGYTFSPDGKFFIASSYPNKIYVFNIEDFSMKEFNNRAEGIIRGLQFSPDGKEIFVCEELNLDNLKGEGKLSIWDFSSMKIIKEYYYKGSCNAMNVSSDGKFVFLSSGDKLIMQDTLNPKKVKTFKGLDTLTKVVTSFSNKLVAGGFDGVIKMWDISSGTSKTLIGHTGYIKSLKFSDNGNKLLSVSDDGTTRLWDISTGKEIAQFISFTDGEWIVITPEGYFNASPNGAKHLNVRVGNNVYSIDNFYEKFFNPVYVASVLQGKKVEAVADIRKGFLTPPEVKIISPEPNKEFSTDTITITVSAKDTGGGIDEIRLYHNGKAVGEDTRGIKIVPKGNETIKTYTVTLVDGINTFRATAFSKDRTESNPYELIVKLTAPQKEVSLYVLAVGINKYKNPALNLNYAVPDAKGITEFFRDQGKGLFKEVEFIEIYDDRATREAIVSKLRELQNTNPQDAVLIYLAGHGENIDDKWYFIPHELTYPEREDEVKAKGLSSDELSGLVKNIKAQKILILIDACKSGAALVAFRGFEDRKALTQLSRATGVHVIAASTKDQFASEVKDLGHGVFTYTLLDGLKGKAAGKGETITVRKLMGYIEERLPDITKKYKQEAQYPVVDSRGMDFPLVLIK